MPKGERGDMNLGTMVRGRMGKARFYRLGLLLVFLLSLTGCASSTLTPAPTSISPTHRLITYKVSGTATKALVTYIAAKGGVEQIDNQALPWEKMILAPRGTGVSLSAQNKGDSGSVTVEIYVNDKPWKTATSTGAYAVAQASGLVR